MRWLAAITLILILLASPMAHGAGDNEHVYHWEFEREHYFLYLHMTSGEREVNVSRNAGIWTINMYVPESDYKFYKVYPGAYRYAFNVSYLSYFLTINDPNIMNLSRALDRISKAQGFDRLTELNFILSFVQEAMGYYSDLNTTGFADYYKFPLETLVEGGGDCEDTSILLYSLAADLGYNVTLIAMNITMDGQLLGHVAVGADVSGFAYGPYSVYLRDGYYHNGRLYYYMETTTNESRGLGIRVYYHVGIAPTEAGYVISDVRFVEYNGYVYHGYSSEHPNVVLGNATRTFPWFLVAVIVIVALYLPLFVIAVKREKPLCPYCGNEVSEEYNYCPNCGFWLKYSEPPEITNRIGEKY